MGVCYEMRKSQLQWFWFKWLVKSFLPHYSPCTLCPPQVRFPESPVPSLCWCWEPSSCQVSGRDRSEPRSLWSRTLIAHSTVCCSSWAGLLQRGIHGLPEMQLTTQSDWHQYLDWLNQRSSKMKSCQFFFPSCSLQICVWYKTHTKVVSKLTRWYCNSSLFLVPLYLLVVCLVVSC